MPPPLPTEYPVLDRQPREQHIGRLLAVRGFNSQHRIGAAAIKNDGTVAVYDGQARSPWVTADIQGATLMRLIVVCVFGGKTAGSKTIVSAPEPVTQSGIALFELEFAV